MADTKNSIFDDMPFMLSGLIDKTTMEVNPVAYEHIFSNLNFKINYDYGTKAVKQYLDPTGCRNCYELRRKYMKLAGLSETGTTGSSDVAIVRCPTHEREYIAGLKKELTTAVEKIGK